MSENVLCHWSRSSVKSMSVADQLPFSQRRYRSSYVIWSSGDFVGSSFILLLLELVVTSQELVQVLPCGCHRGASGQDPEVAAGRGVRLNLGRARQQVLDRQHGRHRGEHVRLARHHEHGLRDGRQVDAAVVGQLQLALCQLVYAEEAMVELAERPPGIGEHV